MECEGKIHFLSLGVGGWGGWVFFTRAVLSTGPFVIRVVFGHVVYSSAVFDLGDLLSG